ncbi:hypothetical protein CTAYLR_001919 [Chrysophaeum taylorii]|uniref:RCK N-terminal domain-containing protein n=1 Tax=Chrysophaeum taylorii TaxID=2483200 RepID=A0AAD7U983_9STRA|nr:hypothetical protein CTAYLR_001919 [Chrysophaeum taylorii]
MDGGWLGAGPPSEWVAKGLGALSSWHLLAPGQRRDALVLMSCAAFVAPFLKNRGTSPILGFLAAGAVLGPDTSGIISQINTERALAELGVAIFLFELGLQVSLERVKAMRKEIFGLGLCIYVTSALALRGFVGASLALSSSAFALQLLRDRDELATEHGRAVFGALLFQSLAIVPLLVAARKGGVLQAIAKAGGALAVAEIAGKRLLDGLFFFAARSRSQEAFLSVVLLTVLSMSALTDALGFSGPLGAFLAGLALSETRYRYQVEADIAPFRGLLLGLFFVTVGFRLDPRLLLTGALWRRGAALVATKATIATLLSMLFGLSTSAALRTGLLLAPGGELAFVALGTGAKRGGIGDPKFLQTTVALTMTATPLLASLGARLGKLVERYELRYQTRTNRDDKKLLAKQVPQVVVCGYGRVGKVVCEMLDEKLCNYICFDFDPRKATDAREKGKPVYFGDLGRPEVLEYFRVGSAKVVVVAVDGQKATNRVVVALRRLYPDLEIIVRAHDKDHQRRLAKSLGVVALVPSLPENSRLLSLPFAGAVLRALDYDENEVDILIEEKRRSALGIYDGFQSANLITDEEDALLEQLGLLNATSSAAATTSDDDDSTPERRRQDNDLPSSAAPPAAAAAAAASGQDEQERPATTPP